jgi:hypothetical protein
LAAAAEVKKLVLESRLKFPPMAVFRSDVSKMADLPNAVALWKLEMTLLLLMDRKLLRFLILCLFLPCICLEPVALG